MCRPFWGTSGRDGSRTRYGRRRIKIRQTGSSGLPYFVQESFIALSTLQSAVLLIH